jgi:hypothetical protein
MVSNLKSETARANGAKSRGPTTAEGKKNHPAMRSNTASPPAPEISSSIAKTQANWKRP